MAFDDLMIGLQWTALVFGLFYVGFATYGKRICWFFLLASTLSIAVVDFHHTHLYFDAVLQLFFAVLSIINIGLWRKHSGEDPQNITSLRISTLDIRRNLAYFLVVLAIAVPTGYFLQWDLLKAYAFLDSVKLLLAIIATFLLIYRILDTWYYWVLVNVMSAYLFYVTGAWPLALLSLIYLAVTLKIFVVWYRQFEEQKLDAKI